MAKITNLNTSNVVSFDTYVNLGRASRCSITLKDPKLSRIHCEIIRVNKDFVLIDLQSQNGTKVNAKPVYEILLKDEDTIEIGKSKLLFQI
ncbi:FHA domain-containing protein [Candidatus Uabimicrobium sp. HlEnr_7]|uniref:FHA domain-containing protein n=1 Tax=Candidatus Uabimicrobium helgolandensis TaxID=3095367 RepID=UPI003558275F